MNHLKVLQLWRYPVKSMAGEQVQVIDVGATGLEGDRRWGVVDLQTGRVLTARREKRLLFASAHLVAPDQVEIRLPDGSLADDAALSRWLDRPVALERAGSVGGTYENPRDFENETDWVTWQGPPEAWHDSARVSLVSTATLDDWDLRRFRPNIVLEGHGEDALVGNRVEIGDVAMEITKQIDRCVMVTRAQPGIETDLDILRTINRTRNTHLAVGARISRPGQLAEGDELTVRAEERPGAAAGRSSRRPADRPAKGYSPYRL